MMFYRPCEENQIGEYTKMGGKNILKRPRRRETWGRESENETENVTQRENMCERMC